MNKKTLILVVIIIMTLGIGMYFLYYSPTDNSVPVNDSNNTSIIYKNTDYGFNFSLPANWQGYSIINNTWIGTPLTNTPAQSGPKLLIRNPKWTTSAPYEDLPVLVFTIPQWNAYLAENFSIGAAPIKASELDRNDKYVFALPARWDFDYSLDYKEAQDIIARKPLQAFNTISMSHKDATYVIDGKSVTLKNGLSVVPIAPDSVTKVMTQYFGNEVTYDLDSDGRLDKVFLLTQNTGGSGTFYYVVGALNTASGYIGSHAVFLGDRIAPQTTEMSRNPKTPKVIIVNYADRKIGESFAVAPSVGKSIWFILNTKTMQFEEVDPSLR